jgi:hypothetical protein
MIEAEDGYHDPPRGGEYFPLRYYGRFGVVCQGYFGKFTILLNPAGLLQIK